MTSLEQEFLYKIEKHKGIIFKISKMYMDDKDDRDDLFQELPIRSGRRTQVSEVRANFQHGCTESL